MVACINDSCVLRAKEKDDPLDLASSQETHFERLSARNRADVHYMAPLCLFFLSSFTAAVHYMAPSSSFEVHFRLDVP